MPGYKANQYGGWNLEVFIMKRNSNNLIVAQTLASSMKSLLGPCHSLKCCTSEGEAVICSSTAKLLQYMDIQHPAGFVINDACQGQYKKYRTSCTTLVCLAGFWSRSAQHLLDQGVPIPVVSHLFDDALGACEKVFQEICLPLMETVHETADTLLPGQQNSPAASDSKPLRFAAEGFPSDVAGVDAERSRVSVDDPIESQEDDDVSWYFGNQPRDALSTESYFSAVLPLSKSSEMEDYRGNGISDSVSSLSAFKEYYQLKNETKRQVFVKTENFDLGTGYVDSRTNFLSRVKSSTVNGGEGTVSKPLILKAENTKTPTLSDLQRTQDTGKASRMPSELTQNSDDVLHFEEDDNDEFDACFTDVSSSPRENLRAVRKKSENDNPETAAALKSKESKNVLQKYGNVSFATRNLQSSTVLDRRLPDSTSKSFSSADEERKTIDKLLSFLSSKRGTQSGRPSQLFKHSEVYRGSRHLVSNSCEESVSVLSSSEDDFDEKPKHSSDNSSHGKRTHQQKLFETSQTSITSLMPVQPGMSCLTREHGKSDVVCRSRCEKITSVRNLDTTQSQSQRKDKVKPDSIDLLLKLGRRLSHGKEPEMKLAVEVVCRLFEASEQTSLEDFEIHVRMIHTEMVVGPPSSFSQNIDGLLLECSGVSHDVISKIKPGTQLVAALVNGDVTPEYRHPGLNEEFRFNRFMPLDDFKSDVFSLEQIWYQSVTHTLSFHGISVVIVKGIVHDSVLDFCLSHSILVIQSVPYSNLQMISHVTGTAIVCYLANLRESDIGKPVTMETWEMGWAPSQARSRYKNGDVEVKRIDTCHFAVIKEGLREEASGNSDLKDVKTPLQTVLLCSPCRDLLCDMEERFWNAVYRLKNSLGIGRVLPGAGACEIACVKRLHELAGEQGTSQVNVHRPSSWLQQNMELFLPLVYKEFAQGIKDFMASVIRNSGEFDDLQQALLVVDELINKRAAKDMVAGFQLRQELVSSSERGNNWDRLSEDTEIPTARNPAGSLTASKNDFEEKLYSLNSVCDNNLAGVADASVWDDYSAKLEAWKRALGVVNILLQSDYLVETGLAGHFTETETGLTDLTWN